MNHQFWIAIEVEVAFALSVGEYRYMRGWRSVVEVTDGRIVPNGPKWIWHNARHRVRSSYFWHRWAAERQEYLYGARIARPGIHPRGLNRVPATQRGFFDS